MKRQLYFITLFFAFFASLLMYEGCTHRSVVSEEEEEAVYLLVGEPCANGDYTTAVRRADSLLSSPLVMSDSLRAFIMIDRDIAILEAGDLDWGDAYADTVIDFGRGRNVGLAVLQGLQHKGIVSRRKGDWNTAISYYKEGLALAVEYADSEMQQIFAEMLAVACTENRLFDEALTFGRQSLDMAEARGDSLNVLSAVATLGAILARSGDPREAIRVLSPYLGRSEGMRGVVRVKVLTPLLQSYLDLDSLAKARELLALTYDALDGIRRDTQVYLVAVNAESVLAGKEGRYADQWRWLQVADSIGTMGTSPEKWWQVRAECLANLHRYAEAYDMQLKAYGALDSVRGSEHDRRLSELTVKYDTLSKDNAIIRLKSQRLFWSLVAVCCISLLAIAFLLFRVYVRRSRLRLERERSEQYIRGLEQERRRLARELHDDIAGSLVGLQCVMRSSGAETVDGDLVRIIGRVRTMSHELMPPEFSRKSFLELLSDFVRRFNSECNSSRIRLGKSGSYCWDKLSPSDSHELYRIVQEATRNAVSHGSGGEIRILLSGGGDLWRLEVRSHYSPGDSAGNHDGIGIRSIRNRARIVGASVDVAVENDLFIIKIYR